MDTIPHTWCVKWTGICNKTISTECTIRRFESCYATKGCREAHRTSCVTSNAPKSKLQTWTKNSYAMVTLAATAAAVPPELPPATYLLSLLTGMSYNPRLCYLDWLQLQSVTWWKKNPFQIHPYLFFLQSSHLVQRYCFKSWVMSLLTSVFNLWYHCRIIRRNKVFAKSTKQILFHCCLLTFWRQL